MGIRDDLQQQLIDHEGLRLKAYRCTAGKLTIGVGRNIEDVGISEAEALFLLRADIEGHTTQLINSVPSYSRHGAAREIALTDMHFNLGHPRFMGFRKMLAAFNAGDFARAADEMLDSRWARQVGPRAETLARQIRTGER